MSNTASKRSAGLGVRDTCAATLLFVGVVFIMHRLLSFALLVALLFVYVFEHEPA